LSTDAAVGLIAHAGFRDARSIRILRLAIGITLAAAIALGIGWPLSFLTAVLATSLLASGAPCPSLRTGAMLVVVIAAAALFGLAVIAPLAIHYPLVCAAAIGLFLFLIFRASYGGTSPFLILWLLIAVLLLPMIAQESLATAQTVAEGMVMGGTAAVGFTWIAHALVPDPEPPGTETAAAAQKPSDLDAAQRDARATVTTCVVYPAALLFYSFGLMSDLLILIFIAILAQQPSLTAGRKAGGALILGNLAGGLAAMIFYQLLVAAPTLGFFVALTALTTLVIGTRIFSERPEAPMYATVLSTVLLLVGGSIAPFGGDVSASFMLRIGQILIAVLYVVGALALVDRIRTERESTA
jgi:hypothetical protein